MPPRLRAGVARTNLTPPVGIAHANWGAQTHARAAGVDLDLYGTVLVLEESDTRAAIVDLDFCLVGETIARPVREAIQELTGIPAAHVRLSYTHTHSGPSLAPTWTHEGDEMIPAYVASLPHRIAGAAWQAQHGLRPARVAGATGCCDINVNRRLKLDSGRVVCGRNWDGFADREVRLVRIDDEQERPLAIVVNYGAHPTIMGPPNQLITPDYPGMVRQVVEQAIPGATCLFLQGAAGNTHAIVDYVGEAAVYRRLGAILGHEAARLALRARTVPRQERVVRVLESGAPLAIYADEPTGEPDGTLRVGRRLAVLPVRPYPPVARVQADAERLADVLAHARSRGNPAEVAEATGAAKRAHMLLDRAKHYAGSTRVQVELHGIRIGDVAMVGFPGEPFAEIGAAVKQRSPFPHTLFGGYTNDYLGYLPTDDARGDQGYEVETSPFAAGAADVVVTESLALLQELRG